MRAVVQRVLNAELKVEGKLISKIGRGLVVFFGVKNGDVPADAVTGTGTNFPGLHISVHNAPGTKCPRCWMHSEQADPETGLCPRCAAVVAAQKAE